MFIQHDKIKPWRLHVLSSSSSLWYFHFLVWFVFHQSFHPSSNRASVQQIGVNEARLTNGRFQISTQHPANNFYSGIGTELTTWTLHCHFQKTDAKQTVDLPFMVVVYEGRHGADLDGVRVIGWILKQAVVRVEELSGDEEEKLPGGSAVVQPAGRMNHETTTTQSSALKTRDDTTLWWQRMSCDSFYRLQKHAVDAVNHL